MQLVALPLNQTTTTSNIPEEKTLLLLLMNMKLVARAAAFGQRFFER